jgi:cell division septation protein DedD
VTTQTHDDGFHEIQLNGKQLVFLFMAATVVSVVIFLCGVLVGRGVRTDRGIVAETAAAQALSGHLPSLADASDGGREVSPPAAEELSYVKRLEEAQPPSEELKPAPTSLVAAAARSPAAEEAAQAASAARPPSKPVPPAPAKSEPPAKPEPAPAAKATPPPIAKPDPVLTAKASAAPEPKAVPVPAKTAPPPAPVRPSVDAKASAPAAADGRDWTVQIAAVNERGEADAMVRRLSTKGYNAFVVAPATGTPVVFRVRVGAFKTKREAENLAVKIQKEERYKPWVTR